MWCQLWPYSKRVKGYLRYKTITSQNVSSEAQVTTNFFVEKLCSFLKIFTKSVMSWWTFVHEIITNFSQLVDVNKSNNFQDSFEQFPGLGLSYRSFSIYCQFIYCQFNKIIKGPGFQSPAWAKNMLEMFVIQRTSIWPNLILIGLGIQEK